MLTADPSRFHRSLALRYFRRRARRRFATIAARGIERLAPWTADGSAHGPLVIVANHSSWWDAAMPMLISFGALDLDAYAVMEERQLQRFGFFRKIGCFSIDRGNPRKAMRSLHYAADLLRGQRRTLWIFPQGEIVPNDARPLLLQSGTAHLLRMLGDCSVAPVAFRYEMLDDELPSAYISVGRTVRMRATDCASIAETTARLTAMLGAEVNALRDAALRRETGEFRTLVTGRSSIDAWWNRVRGIEP